MEFVSPWMLFALFAVFVPVIIHLLNRRSGRVVNWGAFVFLLDSVQKRKKRVLLEDILLLATRCMIMALLALALARPFILPGSRVPWAAVMPLLLLAVVLFGVSFAVWNYRKWKFWLRVLALLFATLAIGSVLLERYFNISRFGRGSQRDIVLVIDGSTSMTMASDNGRTNFEQAIDEARQYIQDAPRGASFGIIVGGPVPQVLTPAPISDRRELRQILDNLIPTHGVMQVMPTLVASTVTLASGSNPGKLIIMIGDGQTAGWNIEMPERWKVVQTVMGQLPVRPQVVWRTLPLPASVRNLAVRDISLSRDIVGTDREVDIRVTVVNTGSEAVTPKEVSLTVEGKTTNNHSIGQLEAGTSQTLTFRHKFAQPGAQVIRATVFASDDIPIDDAMMKVVSVTDTLKVLIVDGNASQKLFDRPSTYLSIALRPEMAEAAALSSGAVSTAERSGFLVKPEVVDLSGFLRIRSFSDCAAIVLADVPRLTDEAAALLGRYVSKGGGLLISPGARVQREFYNNWTIGGENVMPASFLMYAKPPNEEGYAAIDPSTFTGSALSALRSGTDLGKVRAARWWVFSGTDGESPRVAGRLDNKDAFLVTRKLGSGMVAVSALPLDSSVSELPSRGGFVPLAHELVYYLSNPSKMDLNLQPSEGAMISLAKSAAKSADDEQQLGLAASYYEDYGFRGEPIKRIDPMVDFNWGTGGPTFPDRQFRTDQFSVRWAGSIVAQETGDYKIWLTVDDEATLVLAGDKSQKYRYRGGNNPMEPYNAIDIHLEAGVPCSIRIAFAEAGGEARCHLMWKRGNAVAGPIPKVCLQPTVSLEDEYSDTIGEPVEVKGPQGVYFHAAIVQTPQGALLRISRSLVPGLYSVTTPDVMKDELRAALDADGKLPFYVNGGVEESRIQAVTDEQITLLRDYIDIHRTTKLEDVMKTLEGESFGQEIWRTLAYAALILFVLEIMLTRWIAIQRRTGVKEEIAFEESETDEAKAFRTQLDSIKKGKGD